MWNILILRELLQKINKILLAFYFASQSFTEALTAAKSSCASVGSGHNFPTRSFLKAQATMTLNPYDPEF